MGSRQFLLFGTFFLYLSLVSGLPQVDLDTSEILDIEAPTGDLIPPSEPAPLAAPPKKQEGGYKSIVTYLGTDFIMPDGCPLTECNLNFRGCRKGRQDMQKKFDQCLDSEDGQFIGCVTDVLPNHTNITIPVYANLCSALCYEKTDKARNKVERCPYSGKKHDVDPVLQRLF